MEESQEVTQNETQLENIICQKYECKYECPACGNKVPFFLQRSSRSPIVKCPVCGAIIKKSDVQKESILTASKAYNMIGKSSIEEIVDVALKEQEEHNVEEEEISEERVPMEASQRHEERRHKKGIITESLFYKPKTPCEILAEILDEFAFINEDFKTFVMRRCERRGFLHPIELLTLLQRMKSGIRTKDEAGIIAEEYAVALQRELEKAQREGMTYPYIPNLYVPENVSMTDPYVQRLLQILPPNLQPEQYSSQVRSQQYSYTKTPTQYSYPQYTRQTQQPIIVQQPQMNLTPIVELFKTTQQTQIQQQQAQMQLMMQMFQTSQQMTVQSIQTALEKAMQSISEGMKTLAEAIKEIKQQSRQQGTPLTPEILNIIKENAESKAQVQYLQKLLEMEQKHAETIQKIVSEVVGKLEEVLKKVTTVPTGEYKSDEAKLVAQAFSQVAQVGHRLVDALDKRQPIKIIVEALPYLTGTGKPKPKKYKEAETGVEIIKELEEAGLVEE